MTALLRFTAVCMFLVLPVFVFGQNSSSTSPLPTGTEKAGVPGNQTTTDETFELNIAERRITRRDFAAATVVSTDRSDLRLQVGVALSAERIDVLMRNVRGSVRFRGSLQRVFEVLESRRMVASP